MKEDWTLQVFLPIPVHWNRKLRYWHCYVSWSVSFHGRWFWGTMIWIQRKLVRVSMRKGSIGGCKRLPSSFYTQFHQPHAHFFIGDIQRIKMCKRRIILYRHMPFDAYNWQYHALYPLPSQQHTIFHYIIIKYSLSLCCLPSFTSHHNRANNSTCFYSVLPLHVPQNHKELQ